MIICIHIVWDYWRYKAIFFLCDLKWSLNSVNYSEQIDNKEIRICTTWNSIKFYLKHKTDRFNQLLHHCNYNCIIVFIHNLCEVIVQIRFIKEMFKWEKYVLDSNYKSQELWHKSYFQHLYLKISLLLINQHAKLNS